MFSHSIFLCPIYFLLSLSLSLISFYLMALGNQKLYCLSIPCESSSNFMARFSSPPSLMRWQKLLSKCLWIYLIQSWNPPLRKTHLSLSLRLCHFSILHCFLCSWKSTKRLHHQAHLVLVLQTTTHNSTITYIPKSIATATTMAFFPPLPFLYSSNPSSLLSSFLPPSLSTFASYITVLKNVKIVISSSLS